MNVRIPDDLHRQVRSETGLAGLKLKDYVARALANQVEADRAAREQPGHDERERVERARAEARAALGDEEPREA